MNRVTRVAVAMIVVAGTGVMLRPWIDQQPAGRERSSYFDQRRVNAARLVEEIAVLPPELREASGLAVSRTQPGVIWLHNDSGNAPMLYALDLKGKLRRKVGVLNAVAIDWEDIASGPCPEDVISAPQCLYIADTGNNDQSRETLTIHVIAEPMIGGADPARPLTVDARSFRYRYPNQPEDAESLAVRPNGDVIIVTKGRTPRISFFGLSKQDVARAIVLQEVLTAENQGDTGITPNQQLGRWVTAAAISPDGMTLAVRTYTEIFFYAVEAGNRWRDLKRPCFLGDLEPQGEGIDYLDDTTLLLASETSQDRQGVVHRVRC